MQLDQLKRREFIMLLGSASVAWPLAAPAQQPERVRRIGVLMSSAEGDAEYQPRAAAFLQALEKLGWKEDRNLHIIIAGLPPIPAALGLMQRS